jgi:hypothetical protein
MPESAAVRIRYLLGAMQQLHITMTLRTQGVPDEVGRMAEVASRWRQAAQRMQELVATEPGAADQVRVEEPPADLLPRLRQIEEDPLFKASFSFVPPSFKLVEIDHLIAPQREVNLDYVDVLTARLRGRSLSELVEFCLVPRAEPPPVQCLQTAPNEVVFSSPSTDLRFLGGFPKPLDDRDMAVAHFGGQPVQVVALLIGFGSAPINVWAAGRRLVLHNGFHRIVALRSLGVERVPVVVQTATNPDIEFPEQIFGLSRSYLLQHPRPVLVRDFFDDALTVELRLKPRLRTLKLTWSPELGVVPVDQSGNEAV